jgi:hypothetical protein
MRQIEAHGMLTVCTVFSTAVAEHDDRWVPRSAFGPPQDDIAVDDIVVRETEMTPLGSRT